MNEGEIQLFLATSCHITVEIKDNLDKKVKQRRKAKLQAKVYNKTIIPF